MVNVDPNTYEIVMTRGDTLKVTIGMTKGDETYTPVDGDVIRFSVSKKFKGDSGYELLLNKIVPNETLELELEPADTERIAYGTYNYELELTKTDGSKDTFIQATITLLKEVA